MFRFGQARKRIGTKGWPAPLRTSPRLARSASERASRFRPSRLVMRHNSSSDVSMPDMLQCSLLSLVTAVMTHVVEQSDAEAVVRQAIGRKNSFDQLFG